jgi:hypothetical protein
LTFGSIEKYFTLDSGANDVFISSDFERDLLLEGLIKKSDYLTARTYRMADGSQVECRRLKLSNIKIGGFTDQQCDCCHYRKLEWHVATRQIVAR